MLSINWEDVRIGSQVMLYGISGVFLVLILFYIVTKLLYSMSIKYTAKNKNK